MLQHPIKQPWSSLWGQKIDLIFYVIIRIKQDRGPELTGSQEVSCNALDKLKGAQKTTQTSGVLVFAGRRSPLDLFAGRRFPLGDRHSIQSRYYLALLRLYQVKNHH